MVTAVVYLSLCLDVCNDYKEVWNPNFWAESKLKRLILKAGSKDCSLCTLRVVFASRETTVFLPLWWGCSDQLGFWSLSGVHQTQWSKKNKKTTKRVVECEKMFFLLFTSIHSFHTCKEVPCLRQRADSIDASVSPHPTQLQPLCSHCYNTHGDLGVGAHMQLVKELIWLPSEF